MYLSIIHDAGLKYITVPDSKLAIYTIIDVLDAWKKSD
jgi:hypothetical protein